MVELIFDLETTGLDPFSDQIVAIGHSLRGRASVLMNGEKEMLTRFAQVLKGVDKLIGFNITDFDIPFLLIRCMKHSIPVKLPEVFDLVKLSPHRKRLEDWCRLLDIKRSYEVDGSRVLDLYLNKKLDFVKKHCLEDVNAAKIIWKRYKKVTS